MSFFKKIINKTTGYWIHKQQELPVGTDLFIDICEKIQYYDIKVLFDVGANKGQTFYFFRRKVPNAFIYCFEPVTTTFRKLEKNVTDNKCFLECIAFSDEPGQKTIRLFEDEMTVLNSLNEEAMNNTPGALEEKVTIDTVDMYCDRKGVTKIDLLKIDTEGYEIKVLTGARQMMRKGAIPFIYCETGFQRSNKRNTHFADLTDFLAAEEYYFFGLYQVDFHDWKSGNNLGNALYVHKSVFH